MLVHIVEDEQRRDRPRYLLRRLEQKPRKMELSRHVWLNIVQAAPAACTPAVGK
jgi:hypothetical protein